MKNVSISNPELTICQHGAQGGVRTSVMFLVVATLVVSMYLVSNRSLAAAQDAGVPAASIISATQNTVGASGAKTAAQSAVLGTNTVGGSGTTNFIPVWKSSTTLGNSNIFQSGSRIGIGTTQPGAQLVVFSGDSVAIEGKSTSTTTPAILGLSGTERGVEGISSGAKGGVVGISASGDGIGGVACTSCSGAAGVFGMGKLAGAFSGNVAIQGNLAVTGIKAFHIDHPLDPANKYLNHAAVESSEVLNMYSGNVTTDLNGTATVVLPNYFSALNGDYRYQLTVIGQFAQAIILREIEDNTFVIKTDKPSVKVSWQVTGVRHDAWVKNHPLQVEEEKPDKERGYYLDPAAFSQPEEKSLFWLYHSDIMRDAKALWSREETNSQ